MPGDIITAIEALERAQQSEGDPEESSGFLKKIGQNITNSSIFGVNKKQKVQPSLDSTDKSRLKNKMDIVVEQWFKLKKKYVKDEKGETAVSKVAKDADVATQLSKDGKKQGKGLLGWLMGLLGMFGLGKTGAGRALFKVIGGWLWKSLKWIGGKVWGFIKWGIKKGWGILKGIFAGVWKAIKGLGSSAWKLLKGAIAGIGKFFSGLWTGFKNLPVWKAFSGAISGGVSAVKGIFTSAKNTIVNALKSVGNFFKSALQKIPGIGKLFPSLAKSSVAGAAAAAGKSTTSQVTQQAAKAPWWKKGASWIGKKAGQVGGAIKSVATKAGSAIKTGVSYIGKGAAWMKDKALSPAKNAISKYAGTMVKGAGGIFGILRKFVKIPIIGPIIEGFFMKSDLQKLQEQFEKGDITEEELRAQAGKRTVKGVTAMAGASIGAIAGSLIPIPFVGTLLGAIGGDLLGRFIGGLISDHVLKPEWVDSIGTFALGALVKDKPQAPKTMQDFVWRSGSDRPYTFTSKDTVLGMKKGGAISQLLDRSAPGAISKLLLNPRVGSNDQLSSKLSELQLAAINLSNQYLHAITTSVQQLVKKPSGGIASGPIPNVPIPQSNEFQGDLNGPMYADSRSSYNDSPLHMS